MRVYPFPTPVIQGRKSYFSIWPTMAGTSRHRELEVGDNTLRKKRAMNERWLTISTYRTQVLPTVKMNLPTAMNETKTISHRHTQTLISWMTLGLGRLTMSTTTVGNFGSPDLAPSWLCLRLSRNVPSLYSPPRTL